MRRWRRVLFPFLPFLPFLLFLALKQTSLALCAISPNLGERNRRPRLSGTSPIVGEQLFSRVSFLIPKTSEGTPPFSRVAFLLPVPSDHSSLTLGEEFSIFHFLFLLKEGLEVGAEQGGFCNECTQFRQAEGIIGVGDVEFQVATVVILLV